MAKIITRTVITLKVTVLGFDENDTPVTREFDCPLMDDKKLAKYLTTIDTNFTPAKVRKVEQVEQLYGMPEDVFIKYAEKLPPRKDYSQQ